MPLSAFIDNSHEPTDDDLRAVLGKAYKVWAHLIDAVGGRIGPISHSWGFTSKSTGWGLRLRKKERIILYMTPQTGRFLVSFALGEKAISAANRAGLSPTLLKAIEVAPRYAEGRGLRLEISNKLQMADLPELAQIKSEN